MNRDESDPETSGHNLPPGWQALYRALVAQMTADHPDVRIVGSYAKLASLRVHLTGANGAASLLADEYTVPIRLRHTPPRYGVMGPLA